MIYFTRSQLLKLVMITLTLCCIINSVCAGKLPKIQALVNGTKDVAASINPEIAKTQAVAVIKETEIKSSDEEDDANDDDEEDNDDTADNENEPAEKNAVQPAADTSLSVWDIASRLWNWIREDISESLFSDGGETSAVGEGRTFGKIRRLQMALIPLVFKFGVLSAMIAFLVAVGVKTLFLVKVLIVLNLLALLAKFFTFKNNFGHVEHYAAPPAPVWSPYVSSGWHAAPEEHHSNKEIHLHIHGGHLKQPHDYSYGNVVAGKSEGWERRNDPYSAYEEKALHAQPSGLLSNELTTSVNAVSGSGQQYGGSFSESHRMF